MNAQIITIGDELLIGQTIDTNSAFIGSELSSIGFDITRKISIHDRRDDILQTFSGVTGKTELVLVTGGLGPTSDDITKQTICEFFDTRLVLNKSALTMIEEMMRRRGVQMNENNRMQAMVPESCRVIQNERGTAPGMLFEKDKTMFIFMPGVPFEMKYMMTEHILPILKERFTSQVIIHKNIMTYGAPEARLAEMLSGFEKELPGEISLAYLPSSGVIKLRLTAKGTDRDLLTGIIVEQVKKLYRTIPELIYGEDEKSLEKVIGELLKERKQTVSTAESCTGGKIAEMITSIAGSSAYYKGSVIAYDNSLKKHLLGVPDDLIKKYGAVSRQVVEQMALGARKLMGTDFSVATSGIAGPDGGTDSKPVGMVWIAVSSDKGTIAEKYIYGSERIQNILRFSNAALNLLRLQIIRQ
ncbi:MAG TPA: competence/damage-inducible protein A [Bacteroidales bacterium]|nr:competence/damage-inducible protein A [Bacteroidales bacterium]HOX76127.1 competence/damage-inducible protein A [Bacteroidales bacterium]